MKRSLVCVALGAALAYTVAIVALTDWLEIDWSGRLDGDKPARKPRPFPTNSTKPVSWLR